MLPRQYRLKEKRDFLRVYKRGQSLHYPAFVLHFRGNSGGRRIGFSVSRKCGNAVMRNRLKRRFRHAAAAIIQQFPPGRDYIFVIRSAAREIGFGELEAQIMRALARLTTRHGGKETLSGK